MKRVSQGSYWIVACFFSLVSSCLPEQSTRTVRQSEAFIPNRADQKPPSNQDSTFDLTDDELHAIALQIELNETGGNQEALVYWNESETFPSLGLGHAIWVQKENVEALNRYGTFFPRLVKRIRDNGHALPDFLEKLAPDYDCPWPDRATYVKTAEIIRQRQEMLNLMIRTKKEQIVLILDRFLDAEKRYSNEPNFELIQPLIAELKKTPQGWYALLDYVNFKGEGSDKAESYGLKNALVAGAKSKETTPGAKIAKGCEIVLVGRISREPDVAQHREGWVKRCQTYATFRVP
jgi:hypothetical protein